MLFSKYCSTVHRNVTRTTRKPLAIPLNHGLSACYVQQYPMSSVIELNSNEKPSWSMEMKEIPFTEIEGLQVGHAQNLSGPTGVTVIISKTGAAVGVDVRGGAPGTRETDLLDPVNLVQQAHGVFLAGGSAFGLDAAAGIMQYLEEREIGFDVQVTRVPVVCGAVLFDLALGDHKIRPDREMGYEACINAETSDSAQGSVGAGAGATVGKILRHGSGHEERSGKLCPGRKT